MEAYLANRIKSGALTYTYVIGRKPEYKTGIDACLIEMGVGYLIVE